MTERTFDTIGDWLYWCYANLGMARAAIEVDYNKYERIDFIVIVNKKMQVWGVDKILD